MTDVGRAQFLVCKICGEMTITSDAIAKCGRCGAPATAEDIPLSDLASRMGAHLDERDGILRPMAARLKRWVLSKVS